MAWVLALSFVASAFAWQTETPICQEHPTTTTATITHSYCDPSIPVCYIPTASGQETTYYYCGGRGYSPNREPPLTRVMNADFESGNGFTGEFVDATNPDCTTVNPAHASGSPHGDVLQIGCAGATPGAAVTVNLNTNTATLPWVTDSANYDDETYTISERRPSVVTASFMFTPDCGDTAVFRTMDSDDNEICTVSVKNTTTTLNTTTSRYGLSFNGQDGLYPVMENTWYTVEWTVNYNEKNCTDVQIAPSTDLGAGMTVVEYIPFITPSVGAMSKFAFIANDDLATTTCENQWDSIALWDRLALTFEQQAQLARDKTAASNSNPWA